MKSYFFSYFFYFAAENSVCEDYITEKLWSLGFNHTIVPIVLQRSIVENILPPNSFIALDDFSHITELVAYLNYLMENEEKYL